jgi:hypothetical protein
LKKKLTSDEFVSRHRVKETDFTRDRILTFQIVFFLLINFLNKSLQSELDNFFRVLLNKELPVNEVTKGAFSLARKKLGYEAFVELDKDQIEYFYEKVTYKTWHGFRLLGIDGSTARLPISEEIASEYGVHDTSETGVPITYCRLSQAYDVLNNLTIDAQLSNYSDNEHGMSELHSAVFQAGDLTLYDRNYASFWLFALLINKNVDFCARLRTGTWKVAKQLIASGDKEMTTKIYPSKASAKKCKELGLPTAPITLRLICIELSTGEKEVLITSLADEDEFPNEVFSDLYQLRWQVEESYKTMKSRLQIENFSGKSCLSILQDFHAKIFSCNLTAILVSGAEEMVKRTCKKRGKKYKPNFSQALNRMKNSIVLLFCRKKEKVAGYLEELTDLFAANLERVRPDRHYQRNFRKSKRIYPAPYKNPL